MKLGLYRTLVATVMSVAMLVTAPAHAGLQDALDGMFLSTGTAPQAFNSQSRGGFVGGNAAVRMPVRNINLVSFDPPRLSAGCGGIDMFGGSFSFINSDQLVALFRQIAANAVGLAFKAAIDYINPALGKMMQEFQAKMQALNENMKNTCAIANNIVKSFSDPEARKNLVDMAAAPVEAAKGAFDDLMGGFNSLFSEPNGAANTANDEGLCTTCGNPVWKALLNSNAASTLGNPTTADPDVNRTNEIVMNMIGIVITNSKSAQNKTTTGGKDQVDVGFVYKSRITLNDLIDGRSAADNMKFFTCTDGHAENQCTDVAETPFVFQGIRGYVNTMMFGQAAGISDGSSTQPGSIVGKLNGCTAGSCGFSAAQINFLNSVRTPTLALIRKVQAFPGAPEHVATRLVDLMATELAVSYGEAAVKAVRMAFGNGKVPEPDVVKDSEKQRMRELADLRKNMVTLTEQTLAVRKYVETIIQDNPAIFARVK